jgi:hypothetical protein
MNIDKIIKNLSKFPAREPDDKFTYAEVMTALYREIGFEWHSTSDLDGFDELAHVTIHQLLQESSQSTGDFDYLIVSYKSVPFALVYQVNGSYSDNYFVLDKPRYVELARHLAAFLAEQRIKELDAQVSVATSVATTLALRDVPIEHMKWHSSELGLFSFNSAFDIYGFHRSLENYSAVIQLDDGSLHEVVKIIPFKHWSDKSHPERNTLDVKTTDGETRTVDSRNILFFLIRQEDPVGAARTGIPAEDGWRFENRVSYAGHWFIRCTQYEAGKLIGKHLSSRVVSRAPEVVDEFVEKFAEGFHPGIFNPEEHGLENVG